MYKTLMMAFLLLLLPVLTCAAPPAALHQTGQTKCYDASGVEIACTGTGQDGELLAGVAWPVPRFDLVGMTMTDKLTGLIWSVDADPAATAGVPSPMDWQHALDYIKTLNNQNYLGYNDWRLPNLHELKSLLNYQVVPSSWFSSQIGVLNAKAGYYWTSTTNTNKGKTASAWLVNMGTGVIDDVTDKNFGGRVWPVRGDDPGGLIRLPKTGQTSCWSAAGVSILCDGTTGQDGELHTGASWPVPRFSDLGDQVSIRDNLTGLIWSKDAFPAGVEKNWQGALNAIATLNNNSALYKDWRLPNAFELESLISLQDHLDTPEPDNTAWLASKGFINVQADYWTATTDATTPGNAWRVTLADATNYSRVKSELNNVWAVRTDINPPVITASPAGGKHQRPLTVTLTSNEPTTIYYTTSGSDPTSQSTVYSGPLSLTDDRTLKFFGVDSLGNTSSISTESYTMVPLTTATPPGGSYVTPQTVTLTSNEPTTIYYTTNGATPTTQSASHSSPLSISIASDTTLKFFGVNSLKNAEDVKTETYLFVTPVNGACGSANGKTFPTSPTTNLCSAGTPSAVTASDHWNWTCAGANGGTTASCAADIVYQVTFVAGTGGSITGTLVQTVKHGENTSPVTAVPDAGYSFVNWTASGGFAATQNPLAIGPVISALTVTANFGPAVTITTKPLTKPLSYRGAKKKLSFTAASTFTPAQISQVISKSGWISIDPLTIKFAKGKGSLTFTVAANPTTDTPTGEVKIGNASFLVTQAPTPCKIMGVTVTVDNLPKTPVPKAGGTMKLAVDVFPNSCKWTVATAKVSPCPTGTDPAVCLQNWFADKGNFPNIGDILTGDQVLTATVTATDKARSLSGKVVISAPPAGKGSKSFSVKQLAK